MSTLNVAFGSRGVIIQQGRWPGYGDFLTADEYQTAPIPRPTRREMSEHQIRFGDGAAHERMMGTWSRLAGGIFLDWLTPPPGLRWIKEIGSHRSPTALA